MAYNILSFESRFYRCVISSSSHSPFSLHNWNSDDRGCVSSGQLAFNVITLISLAHANTHACAGAVTGAAAATTTAESGHLFVRNRVPLFAAARPPLRMGRRRQPGLGARARSPPAHPFLFPIFLLLRFLRGGKRRRRCHCQHLDQARRFHRYIKVRV